MARLGYKTFLVLFVAGALIICGVIVGLNVLINPYGIWTDRLHGKYAKKTARLNSVRMVKAYDLLKACPDAVITGMSSVVWGIDPLKYPVAGKKLYNGGIVGSNVVEQYAYVRTFLDQCPNISKLYIDVNFESYFKWRMPPSDFIYDRLDRSSPTFGDIIFTTLSRSAILASLQTIQLERDKVIDSRVFDRGDGFHRIPDASYEVYKNNFLMYLNGVSQNQLEIDDVQIAYLAEMVRLAESRGVDVQAYFAPIHYWLHYMRRYDGPEGYSTDRLQAELKRKIAQIHDFWDFNLYNRISAEPVDHADHFIDMIHYRPVTGQAVLSVINGQRQSNLPENFGVIVTRENVEQYLTKFNAGLDQWEGDVPEDAARIRAAFKVSAIRASTNQQHQSSSSHRPGKSGLASVK